jgi:hypothetical protein
MVRGGMRRGIAFEGCEVTRKELDRLERLCVKHEIRKSRGKDSSLFFSARDLRSILIHISRLECEARAGRELREGIENTITSQHLSDREAFDGCFALIKAYDDTATKESKHD